MGETIKFAPKNEIAPQEPQPDLSEVIAEPKRGPLPKTESKTSAEKVGAYLKELKQVETKKRMEELRKQIGLPKKETASISLSDLKTKIMDSQHRKLAASDFEPMAAAAKMEQSKMPRPADMRGAALDAEAEVTPPPHTFWGKMTDRLKWLVSSEHRDIRANQKFAAMSADTDETPADRRAAAKGEAMMKKQNMADAQANVKEKELLLKAGLSADRQLQTKPVTENKEEALFKPNVINRIFGNRQMVNEDTSAKKFETKFDKKEAKKTMAEPEDTMSPQAAANKRLTAEHALRDAKLEEKNAISGEKNIKAAERQLEQINGRLVELKQTIESIKIGWLTKLNVDEDNFITNLPLHEQEALLHNLMRKKEKAGQKGLTDEANEFLKQAEGLDEYLELLTKRDKFRAPLL